jgi:hypothetical protein
MVASDGRWWPKPRAALLRASPSWSRMGYRSPHNTKKGRTMKIKALIDSLQTLNPDGEAFVHLCKAGNIGESFAVDAVLDNNGHAQLVIYEDDEVRAAYRAR